MKICCIGYFPGVGGAEKQLISLANNLAEHGHEVYLLALAHCDIRFVVSDKVTVIDLSQGERASRNALWYRYAALRAKFKEIAPDITVHFWVQSLYLTAGMPESIRGKLIYSERGDPSDDEYKGLLGLVRNLAFLKCDGFAFQSNSAMNYFGKDVVAKSVIIPNPINVSQKEFVPFSSRKSGRVVTVGRLCAQKNQVMLLKAFAKAHADCPELYLDIYGEGPLLKELKERCCNLGIEDAVCFRGVTSNIYSEIADAQIFAFCSDFEGMPNALLEAMSLGLVCITTDYRPNGAVRDFIVDKKNGFITKVNDVDGMADLLKSISTNSEIMADVSHEATKVRSLYTPEVIYGKWETLVQAIGKGKQNS